MSKLLSKGLVALLSALTFSVMAAEEAVEVYSDEMPKLFLYKEGEFLPGQAYVKVDAYSRVEELNAASDNKDRYHFYLPDDENNAQALFVRDFYKKESVEVSDIIKKAYVSVCEGFFSPDRWKLPRHISKYNGDMINLYPLSWHHLDVFLHSAQKLYPNIKLDNLYQLGLEGIKSHVSRWLFIRDKKHYRIFFIYNNDEELKNIKLETSIF